MLAEWLERIWSSCPGHLRQMGCLSEMLGIRRRWRRFHRLWQPHCQRSRQVILTAVERCRQRRRCLILGSGWLHDVPVEELSRQFAEVVLVDLFHPWSVRWRGRRFRNVRLVAEDVTGSLESIWRAGQEQSRLLPCSTPTLFLDTKEIDFVVSLNLLSQLPCMPERYLRRMGHDEIFIGELARWLVQSHLEYLARLPGVVTLIADTEIRTVKRSGEVLRREPTLYGVNFPYECESWSWTLVPANRSSGWQAEVLTVVAVEDIKTAKRMDAREKLADPLSRQ